MDQAERRTYLIKSLCAEDVRFSNETMPADEAGQEFLLRGLMNVRLPGRAREEFLNVQDEYLRGRTAEKGLTNIDDIAPSPGMYVWKGDITTISCDAIVNAANSGMTGCYVPNHNCIDNCIHTFAGVQLRLRCAEIMRDQGHEEPVGRAKITPGYNLPAKYILHTVGPTVNGRLTDQERSLLRSSYVSCLALAEENGLENIVFCCISTGVFGFPKGPAAMIATETVRDHLRKGGSVKRVVFNVFDDENLKAYSQALERDAKYNR